MWSSHWSEGAGWFRVFGVGLSFKDHRRHPALFSERYNYTRHWHIGPWCITYLRRK